MKPNCGVTAVAVISGVPFETVFAFMKQGRGPAWQGMTYLRDRLAALDHFGIKYRTAVVVKKVTLRSQLPFLTDGKTYMVDVTGHSFVIRGHMFIDQRFDDWVPLSSNQRLLRKYLRSVVQIVEQGA